MTMNLPRSVRYVKNGPRGRWWKTAKALNQVHAGWRSIPHSLLCSEDFKAIEKLVRAESGNKLGVTQDLNALRTLLISPSAHVWVTFEDGCMWWCTVHDGAQTDGGTETFERGHFWLRCQSPWSNHSVGNKRHLAKSELPGEIAAVAGFRATVCTPSKTSSILRIINNEEDEDAVSARLARQTYEDIVSKLVAKLGDKDFELLIDLILSRTGWARIAKVGGPTEGIDIEVENVASDEIAFVQVKSIASQGVLNDYMSRFNNQRERYQRMIFAVHSPVGDLRSPPGEPISIWTGKDIARRTVKLGLGDWVANRI